MPVGLGGRLDKKRFDELYQFEYDKFFKLLFHVGDSLNSRKDRFDKADLIEAAITAATGNRMKWVDKVGYDLQDAETGLRFECKSQKHVLYTEKSGKKRKTGKTSRIKLTNTLQQGSKKKLRPTADYLLLVDSGHLMLGIVPYKKVVDKYTRELKDGFECEIPLDEVTILFGAPHGKVETNKPPLSYKKEKMKLLENYVGSFFKNED
jgi:hypothetical protein